MRTVTALSAFLLSTVTIPAFATEYHLYPGDSIAGRLASAQPGDVLTLHNGTAGQTHNRAWLQNINGRADAWITIRGAPDEPRPRIYYGPADKNMIDLNSCSYMRWQHLEIQGGSDGIKMNGTCHDLVFEDLYIHHIADVGINASGIVELYNLVVRDCEIAYTGWTGEGMYLGKHGAYTGKQVHHALIERNYLHHMQSSQGQGDGIELKHGCHSVVIQDNMIIANAYYPAITTYATYKNDPASNIVVRRNFIYGTEDSGVFSESEIDIVNNLIVNSLGTGIYFRGRDYDGKLQHVRVVNNTVFGAASDCLAVRNGNIATNFLVANNAFIQDAPGKSAMAAYQGIGPGVTLRNNVVYGTVSNFGSGYTVAVSPASLFANPALSGAMDFFPKAGSPLLDAADPADAPGDDFNLLGRPFGAAPDIGAYEVHYGAENPGWAVGVAFKDVETALTPGDINRDGGVTMADVVVLAASWNARVGDAAYNGACDIDGDGAINIFDIFVIAENWNVMR